MSESRNQAQSRKLMETAMQLMALARELEGPDARPAAVPDCGHSGEADDTQLAELARQIYTARRQRAGYLGNPDFFGEAAWDIYLDLYIAAHENRKVSVSSACIAAAVPSTTALRWLRLMETEGLVVREADPSDHRRINVSLGAEAFRKMKRYLRSAARNHPVMGMQPIPMTEG